MPRVTTDTALVVVDMQNGFCSAQGSFARMGVDVSGLQAVLEPCRRLVQAARGASAPVIFSRYVYKSDYSDHGTLFRPLIAEMRRENALIAGSWDVDILPELAPEPEELVLDKNRPSCFFGTSLNQHLREIGVRRVVVCGVTTSCCVESTVRDAGQHDYETFVVSDATAEMTQERHLAALHTLGFLFADVVTVAQAERDLLATDWADVGNG